MNCYAIPVTSAEQYLIYLRFLQRVTDLPLASGLTPEGHVRVYPFTTNKKILVHSSSNHSTGKKSIDTYSGTLGLETLSLSEWCERWLVAQEQALRLKPLVFPETAKYNITYRTEAGEIKEYEISNPIESNNDTITAYAFKRGIRSFKKSRITRLEKQKVG